VSVCAEGAADIVDCVDRGDIRIHKYVRAFVHTHNAPHYVSILRAALYTTLLYLSDAECVAVVHVCLHKPIPVHAHLLDVLLVRRKLRVLGDPVDLAVNGRRDAAPFSLSGAFSRTQIGLARVTVRRAATTHGVYSD
jgi:hypothetical protein